MAQLVMTLNLCFPRHQAWLPSLMRSVCELGITLQSECDGTTRGMPLTYNHRRLQSRHLGRVGKWWNAGKS